MKKLNPIKKQYIIISLKILMTVIVFFCISIVFSGKAQAWVNLKVNNSLEPVYINIGSTVGYHYSWDVGCGESCNCNSGVSGEIDWGDGIREGVVDNSPGHTYNTSNGGCYNVQIFASRTCNYSNWGYCNEQEPITQPSNIVQVCVTEDGSGSTTVDIKANGSDGPISIPYDTSANLTWESTNAIDCFMGSHVPTEGSQSTGNLTSFQRYLLTCVGPPPYGDTDTDYVDVNVLEPDIVYPGIPLKIKVRLVIEDDGGGGTYCGDNVVQPPEQCDPPGSVSSDGKICNAQCRWGGGGSGADKIFRTLFVANQVTIDQQASILQINYDSTIVNNIPPGFRELLAPLWKEINP